ncbi:MAG: hypothetical protein AB1442_07130 [Nitrospirota bacterium]
MQSTVETTDIFRGAFFLSKGGKLSDVHLSEDHRQIVSFRIVGDNLTELDEAYRSGKATVDPLQLRESLNHLRDVLFKTKRENERNKERRAYADKQERDRSRQAVS